MTLVRCFITWAVPIPIRNTLELELFEQDLSTVIVIMRYLPTEALSALYLGWERRSASSLDFSPSNILWFLFCCSFLFSMYGIVDVASSSSGEQVLTGVGA